MTVASVLEACVNHNVQEFANFTAECGFDPSKFAAYLTGFGAALMRPASRQIAQKLAFLHAYMTKCMTHANAILLT